MYVESHSEYKYIDICTFVCVCEVYIYIYIERERERIYMYKLYIYVYIHMYIYINICKWGEIWAERICVHTYIYIYVCVCVPPYFQYFLIRSSSSSCRAGSTNISDLLSPLFPIVHRPRLVFRTTSCILT